MINKFFKKIVKAILWNQVKRLRSKNNFKIIGVVGSMGKTSTKIAIAEVLSKSRKVRYEKGNYNDAISIPFIFFGNRVPSLYNPFKWLFIFLENEASILSEYNFDFVIIEIGTDGPNQISELRNYIKVDLGVITAVSMEHMEYFKDVSEVAEEEWSLSLFSDLLFVNRDLVDIVPDYVNNQKIKYYGKNYGSLYTIKNIEKKEKYYKFSIYYNGSNLLDLSFKGIAEVSTYSLTVASIIALHAGINKEDIITAVSEYKAFKGRMQVLSGIKNSLIIDDSYNASPDSTKNALDTLYKLPNRQKIALLGMMNELGDYSKKAHEDIGSYCDPNLLDWVVTLGVDSNKFLSKSAKERGCKVYEAKDPYDAGDFIKNIIDKESAILIKGSQNGVYSEEAIKSILSSKEDVSLLVRQDKEWILKKKKIFKKAII